MNPHTVNPPARGKVLLLQSSPDFGGSRRSLISLVEILRDAGYVPVVASSNPGWVTEQLQQRSIAWIQLPFYAWRKWLERFRVGPSIRKTWMARLRPHRFQLIHSNEFWWAPHAILAAHHLGIPSLVHLRDGHHTLKKALQYRLPQASAIIAVSSELRAQFTANSTLLSKTEVIFNAHEDPAGANPIDRTQARAQLGLSPTSFVIANIGHLCDRKNQLLLVNTLASLLAEKNLPEFNLLFAGDSDPAYSCRLQVAITNGGLEPHCRLLGPIPDIGKVYSAADLLVHCAQREGLPRVIPEAMLAGRPVIATLAEGVRDALPDEHHGIVLPPNDSIALGRAILQLAQNPEHAQLLADTARKRARLHFTCEAHRQKILALYDRCRSPAPSPPSS